MVEKVEVYDILLVAYLAAACVLVAVARMEDKLHHVAWHVAMLAVATGAVALRPAGNGALRAASYWYPVVLVPIMFSRLPVLIPAVSPESYDATLASIDYGVFGVHPTVWLERFMSTCAVEVLTLAYLSYFVAPIVVGASLYARDFDRFRGFTNACVAVWVVSYLGYFVVPALGPRVELAHLQSLPLADGPTSGVLRRLLDALEKTNYDAYPSGHAAIAVVVAVFAAKWLSRLRWVVVPSMALLIVSTVYLRYHYVVDVVAGTAIAAGLVFLAPRAAALWDRARARIAHG